MHGRSGDLHQPVGVIEQAERDADELVRAISGDDLDGVAAAGECK